MRRSRIFWILLIAVAMLTLVAVSCGEDKEEKATPPAGTAAAKTPATTPQAGDTTGITDTQIIIGTHQPLTGPAAAYAQISKGLAAYFDYINEAEGGVYGRKIKLLVEDDGYSPPQTVEVVRRLVEQDKIFAMLGGLGTATHMQVVDYLMDRGVPDFFVSTGALEWVKDPEARPNVFGILPNYIAEGIIFGKYITETYPGVKVGVVGQNDDFGLDGYDGVKRGLGDGIELLPLETFESTDPDVNSQVDRLKAAGAGALVVFATPGQSPAAIRHARADLGWNVPIMISTVSANELTFLVAGAKNMEGVISDEALKHAYETDDPAIALHLANMDKYANQKAASNLTLYGQTLAETFINALKVAGPDLTREGVIAAAENAGPYKCSVCLFTNSMSPTDHDASQSVVLSKVELDPTQTFGAKWVPFVDFYYSWQGILPQDLTADNMEKLPYPEKD